MTRKMLLLVILLGVTCLNFCKRVPTLPEPEPGPRNYMWEVDTLNMEMNLIDSIWGASPTDVWTVGAGGTYQNRLQHFNGANWSAYNKEPILIAGNTLFGFRTDDVWMGGGDMLSNNAALWHYNGTKWSQHYVYGVKGSYQVDINDIWGIHKNNIYACGIIGFKDEQIQKIRGFVLHYDGQSWKEVVQADFPSQFHTVRSEGNKVYIFSSATENGIRGDFEIYEIKNRQLNKIYTGPRTTGISLYTLAGRVYFSIDHDVCRYIDGSFVKQFTIDLENFGNRLYARHEKDQFIRMVDGIAHYNGQNIEYLYTFPKLSINIRDGVLLDKDVFFCCQSNSYELIIHGSLNK